jgi:glucose dehydrogenase
MRPLLTVMLLGLVLGVLQAQEIGWSANGRDIQGTRYSPAPEITRETVSRLEVAWTYRTGETGPLFTTTKPTAFEATPLASMGRCTSGRRSGA